MRTDLDKNSEYLIKKALELQLERDAEMNQYTLDRINENPHVFSEEYQNHLEALFQQKL